jgi:hypothetical protein
LHGEYQPDANDLLGLEEISAPISKVWPEPPPCDCFHGFVRRPPRKQRNITPTELTLEIKSIDKTINKEIDSLREMVETFLKNPEPRT